MGQIANELTLAIQATGAMATVSIKWNSPRVLSELSARFAAADRNGELWERLSSSFGYRDPNAWRLVSDFTSGQRCLLALPSRLESAVFEFENGFDLTRVLEQCSGFEFYATDEAFSYLLCSNHHDYLVSAGTAKDWLEQRVRSQAQS
jgi:hypothetical protein